MLAPQTVPSTPDQSFTAGKWAVYPLGGGGARA
jgi:hypothetical protein